MCNLFLKDKIKIVNHSFYFCFFSFIAVHKACNVGVFDVHKNVVVVAEWENGFEISSVSWSVIVLGIENVCVVVLFSFCVMERTCVCLSTTMTFQRKTEWS